MNKIIQTRTTMIILVGGGTKVEAGNWDLKTIVTMHQMVHFFLL
jgi:hypothetical protein